MIDYRTDPANRDHPATKEDRQCTPARSLFTQGAGSNKCYCKKQQELDVQPIVRTIEPNVVRGASDPKNGLKTDCQ